MLYIILLIIVVFVYLIYKRQNPPKMSGQKVQEYTQADRERKEEALLDHIKTNHLKNYMKTETALYECGKKNFIRLSERFKHDNIKLHEVMKDWFDYMEILNDVIYESQMLDVSSNEESNEHWEKRNELYIQIQEIEKRFKDLLGKEYIDPDTLINPGLHTDM